jgi:quercetin dioxygenase-like cupin family protein
MSEQGVWENAEPGVQRKILPPGQSLMMMMVRFEAGAEGYEHAHPHEQMTLCLDGRFEFVIDGEKHVIGKGENLHIPCHAVHGVKALEKGMLLDCFTPLRDDLLNRHP